MAPWDFPDVGIHPATVVGANPVLADDDDTSYIETRGDAVALSQWAIGDLAGVVPGAVTHISADMRVQDVHPTGFGPLSFTAQLWDSHGVGVSLTASFDIRNAASPAWVTGIPITSGDATAMDLSGSAEVRVVGSVNPDYVGSAYGRLFEVVFHITYSDATLNPLQRWPDGIATGPSRQWPRRITRRPGTY